MLSKVLMEREYYRFWLEDMPEYLESIGFNRPTAQIMIDLGRAAVHNRWMKRRR